ncbi:MAG: OmpA family protein [Halomonas sp.]|uniref:OmpA/MotB family protein n=1 Tax=Halomonas sp. TaxID=1486246 RepID=UPI0039710BBB
MVDEHRGPSRYNDLLDPIFDEEGNGGWMISYMDIMTLLVALLVLIIVASGTVSLPIGERPPQSTTAAMALPVLGVPLPEALSLAVQQGGLPQPAQRRLDPDAIRSALRVAATPRRWERHSATAVALPSGIDTSRPLRRYLLVVTDHLPGNARQAEEQEPRALSVAVEREQDTIDLPNLDGVMVSRVPQGIRVRLEENLLFPTAEAVLTPEGRAMVDSLVETVQRFDGTVSVEGHSDDRPINTPAFSSNWALSSARAIAIVHALEAAGIDSRRLQAVGLAATQPLVDNNSEAGRSMNRRVEVVIHVDDS